MRRALAVVTLIFGLNACTPAPPPAPPLPSVGFEATACDPSLAALGRDLTCGVLRAPQDRANPAGLTVAMPVVVVRARLGQPPKTPVIYLHGGPGGAVVARLPAILAGAAGRTVFTPDRDWVFFDQRGGGLGTPNLDCGALSLTDAGIANDADMEALRACFAGFTGAGVDFGFYNSKTIADDIQDIRAAFGYEAFDLFGVSYGTRIALAVAQYRPEGLRAMVLDSPYPPEARGTQELPRIAAGFARHLMRPEAGLDDRFSALITSWEKAPPEGVRVDDLGQFIVDLLYDRAGVANFRQTVKSLIAGDLRALKAYIENRSGYAEAQNIAHFCKEELPFEQVSRMRAWAATDAIARAVAAPATRYFAACDLVNVGPPEPREIEPYRGPVPALFLVAGIDPGCPLEFAAPAAKNMANAQLVAFEARTHGVTRDSPCAVSMMRSFLDQPNAPVDRTCLAREPRGA
jgi:pimeloyl-ACP methyl ester carboxylesterase